MGTTTARLVAEARERIENLDVHSVAGELANGALLVDVREPGEREASGAIPGSLHVPRGLLEFQADPAAPSHLAQLDPGRRTILYCAVGGRSALAARSLQRIGYVDVAHLDGGMQAWQAADRPVEWV